MPMTHAAIHRSLTDEDDISEVLSARTEWIDSEPANALSKRLRALEDAEQPQPVVDDLIDQVDNADDQTLPLGISEYLYAVILDAGIRSMGTRHDELEPVREAMERHIIRIGRKDDPFTNGLKTSRRESIARDRANNLELRLAREDPDSYRLWSISPEGYEVKVEFNGTFSGVSLGEVEAFLDEQEANGPEAA